MADSLLWQALEAMNAPRKWAVRGLGGLTGVENAEEAADLISGWTGADRNSPLVQAAGFAGNIALDPLTYAMPWAAGRMAAKFAKPAIATEDAVKMSLTAKPHGFREAADAIMGTDWAKSVASNAEGGLVKNMEYARRRTPMIKDIATPREFLGSKGYSSLDDFLDARPGQTVVTGGESWTGSPLLGRVVGGKDRGSPLYPDQIEALMQYAKKNQNVAGAYAPDIGAMISKAGSDIIPAEIARGVPRHEIVHAASSMASPQSVRAPEVSVLRAMRNHDNPLVRAIGPMAEEALAMNVGRTPNVVDQIVLSPSYGRRFFNDAIVYAGNETPSRFVVNQLGRLGAADNTAMAAAKSGAGWPEVMKQAVGKYLQGSPTLNEATKAGLEQMPLKDMMELLFRRGILGAGAISPLAAMYGDHDG